jgi:aspartyl-tRNA(Asn)/glutamyl-tRNA(Gln) amidotransferase subunit C
MISEDDVQKLANLARLELESSFTPVITGHLNSILEYVQRLDQVDTSSVAPMSHVHGATNVLREDVTYAPNTTPQATPLGDPAIPQQEMLPAEGLLQNVPDHSGRFIRVPLIVE